MSNTIPLYENAHATTQRLLPWYVNGALDESECALVEAHVESCAECRAELEAEHQLGTDVVSLALDVDQGWAKMQARIAAPPAASAKIVWFRRRVPLVWAVAAQAIAATLLVAILMPHQQTSPADYRALGNLAGGPKGNLIVMFADGARETDMRRALASAKVRLVGGPTASGAYLLDVAPAGRPAALQALHDDKAVSLAEPIDPGAAP
jgi:hypothetical protein